MRIKKSGIYIIELVKQIINKKIDIIKLSYCLIKLCFIHGVLY